MILADWTGFARAAPTAGTAILALFAERAEIDPAFAVVLA